MYVYVLLWSIYRFFFFFNDTATTEIYTLSLHDALPICRRNRDVRILLVEDDRMIGEALQGSLRDAGHEADWVLDAQAAWVALGARSHDLILLDLGLPGQDGLHLLRRLRASGDAVPVIVVTARDALDSRIAGLDAGADDYVVKPFEMPELLARIRAVARRRAGDTVPVLR